jgi:hypothetical protein
VTDSGDIKRMQAIGADLARWDVVVRWMPGWDQRGSTWSRVPVGIVDHHDASRIKSGEWGALGYIVANNLSQFQVARCLDNVPKLAINAAGISWHPGKGSWRFPDGVYVPPGEGAYWLYGAEKAHSGSASEPMTEAFHYATDALFRSVLERCG